MLGVEAAGRVYAQANMPRPSLARGRCAPRQQATSCRMREDRSARRIRLPPAWTIPVSGRSLAIYAGRAQFVSATDSEAIEAIKFLAEVEGIIPALESAHAVAAVMRLAPRLAKHQTVIIGLSGRR